MSWFLHAVPLHALANDGMADWVASASLSRGVPDQVPAPAPLPSVGDVLRVFRTAGCHGSSWFTVTEGSAWRLPECADPSACSRTGGLDLGEVGLGADGDRPLSLALVADGNGRTP